jgi:hypothetical protein
VEAELELKIRRENGGRFPGIDGPGGRRAAEVTGWKPVLLFLPTGRAVWAKTAGLF